MAKPSLPEDRVVLQAKFETVHRLVQVYADGIKRVEAKLATVQITQPDAAWEQLILTLHDSMMPLCEAAVDTSLIDADLAATKADLGDEFVRLVASGWKSLRDALAFIQNRADVAHAASVTEAKAAVLSAITSILNACVLPAKKLRGHFQRLLNRQPKERVETPKQARIRERNDRIRSLSIAHGTRSAAQILKLAQRDERLSQLQKDGIRVTLDVIRNVLEGRPRYSKKNYARRKIPVKRKN
jgi:hypothetical protein